MIYPNDDNIDLNIVDDPKGNNYFGDIPIQGYNSIVREILWKLFSCINNKNNYTQNKDNPLPPSLKIVLSEF